jgi:hypothetical protein
VFGASAVVLLLGAALGVRVAFGGQASASTTPVIITGFAATPATITYGHTTVTVSGKLVEYGRQTAGVPGEQVQVEFGTSTAISTNTGADGSFSATVSLPKGGNVFAEFNGDTAYGYTRTGTVAINATAAQTRVTLNGLPAPVLAGNELTFTGRAEVKVAGSWEPLPGARVELDQVTSSLQEVTSGTTGSGGQFSLTATVTGFGQYRVTLDAQAAAPLSLYGSSQSNVDLTGGSYRTRIAAVSLPATPEAHQSFTVTGVAQVWNGTTWTGYAGMPVQYFYQVQGTSTWVYAGAAQTDASGGFSGVASVQPGQLGWQIRVPASGDGNKFLPSASTTYAGLVTDQTCVTGLAVSRGRRTEIQAQVQDSCATGQQSFGEVSGQVAEVYYSPRGSTTWSLLGQARTDANGFVDYMSDGSLRGSFKVVFPAQGYYLGSTSQTG